MALKLTALMIVINEEDWVWWSLRSIYDVVDHIVIVEGVAKDKWKEFGSFDRFGLSLDNTEGEIERFIEEYDSEGKIKYIQAGFQPTIGTLRELALRECPKDTDYILVADADHLYDESQLQQVKSLCEQYPNIRVVYSDQLIFFLDMHHVLQINEEYKRPYGHHLACLFYRYDERLRYKGEISFFDNQFEPEGWLHPILEVRPDQLEGTKDDVAVYPPMFQFWHFGWVGRRMAIEAHLLKTTWSRVLRLQWLLKHDPEKVTDTDRNYWMPFIDMSAEEILDYHRLYHKIWTGIFDDKVGERVVPYLGKYPMDQMLRSHPFFGKSKHWFGLEEGL